MPHRAVGGSCAETSAGSVFGPPNKGVDALGSRTILAKNPPSNPLETGRTEMDRTGIRTRVAFAGAGAREPYRSVVCGGSGRLGGGP